ncbi:ring-cleaving dioxygenase [Lentibacillus saliphilus]|uniref:ring-cleaving dioxygenase n=1 Tax=Lentibacillus saliphilus TaxID=2737028 RepID=UPI001C2F54A2|nr:ring-cleaving dioxygenase [Lentibacillus saliphilus]
MELKGIHHVSALTGDARKNYDFYTNVLGMRLIKKTVNQDDISVYHLFYGDEVGHPGTELTFFEIPMSAPNYDGNNSISNIALRVADDGVLEYWTQRLDHFGIKHERIKKIAGHKTLAFRDPEGQRLSLVSDEYNLGVEGGMPWDKSVVPVNQGILGLGPIKLTVPNSKPTSDILENLLGFRKVNNDQAEKQGITIYETGKGGHGAQVHLEERTDLSSERLGKGGVHHVAFRAADELELKQWITKLQDARIPNSGFVDRFYFRSLYFREPNGILFEIATDGPGFATDEHIEHLGESLALPPFLETKREQIEQKLKPLHTKRS